MRTFSGITPQAYQGQPQTIAIKLAGIATYGVPLTIPWALYGASSSNQNINIAVDLTQKSCSPLEQIRCVYIDNLGCDVPVYVNFPDTNYTVVAKPNSEGWYPVYTNKKQFNIIGEGFINSSTPQTLVIATNISLTPSVNNEIDTAVVSFLASATIARGSTIYDQNYSPPALGDQLFEAINLPVAATGNIISNVWGTPLPSGFIYVSAFEVQISGISSVGANGAVHIQLGSSGVSGKLDDYFFESSLAAGASLTGIVKLRELSGMNLKIDATQTWQLNVLTTSLTGKCNFASVFTTNPN